MTPRGYAHLPPRRSSVPVRATLADKVHVGLAAGYVAFAGIYWFPGVSYVMIAQAKLAIFAGLALIGLLRFRIYGSAQRVMFFGLGLCAFMAFVTVALSNGAQTGLDRARDFVEPLLWLIALYGIQPRAYPTFLSTLTVGMTVSFVIFLYPILAYIGVLPDFHVPTGFFDETTRIVRWPDHGPTISNSGFSASRTGWGVVVAPAAMLIVALYLRTTPVRSATRIIVAAIVVGSAASIIVTGARGGTFALVAASAYGIAISRNSRFATLVLIMGVCLAAFSMDLIALIPDQLWRHFDTTGSLYTRLNAITTGRLASDVGAFEIFTSSPIIGVGPDAAKVWINDLSQVSPHNLWLRLLAESGLLLFLPVLWLTARFLMMTLSKVPTASLPPVACRVAWPDARLAIACGLALAFVEPSVIIGSFNSNAAFWTGIWFVLNEARAQTRFSAVRAGVRVPPVGPIGNPAMRSPPSPVR